MSDFGFSNDAKFLVATKDDDTKHLAHITALLGPPPQELPWNLNFRGPMASSPASCISASTDTNRFYRFSQEPRYSTNELQL